MPAMRTKRTALTTRTHTCGRRAGASQAVPTPLARLWRHAPVRRGAAHQTQQPRRKLIHAAAAAVVLGGPGGHTMCAAQQRCGQPCEQRTTTPQPTAHPHAHTRPPCAAARCGVCATCNDHTHIHRITSAARRHRRAGGVGQQAVATPRAAASRTCVRAQTDTAAASADTHAGPQSNTPPHHGEHTQPHACRLAAHTC